MTRHHRRCLVAALTTLVALAACGGDDDDVADTSAAAATTTTAAATTTDAGSPESAETTTAAAATTAAGATTTVDSDRPQRIISLSPSATETLFAIGAGDQVIAVDDQSDYPPEAAEKMTELSGYTPNIEAIAGYEPDLVLHDGTQDLAGLETLGIATLAAPAPQHFDDIYAQIEQIGAATGHIAEAAELVGQMRTDIEAALGSIEVLFEVAPKIYHEIDSTLFSLNSNTFLGQIYAQFGLQNIADTAEGGTDYPQLSAEFIISQDPDIIFLADADFGESPEALAARPGWDEITAVETGNIVPVDADLASRWGPRVVEYVELVAQTVNELASVPAG